MNTFPYQLTAFVRRFLCLHTVVRLWRHWTVVLWRQYTVKWWHFVVVLWRHHQVELWRQRAVERWWHRSPVSLQSHRTLDTWLQKTLGIWHLTQRIRHLGNHRTTVLALLVYVVRSGVPWRLDRRRNYWTECAARWIYCWIRRSWMNRVDRCPPAPAQDWDCWEIAYLQCCWQVLESTRKFRHEI